MNNYKLTQQANRLSNKINACYNAIDITQWNFFETYHDAMLYQRDGAREVAAEVEHYEKKEDIVNAEEGVQTLKDTLEFCNAILKIQKQVTNLPTAIFG